MFDFVRLPNPIERLEFDWVRLVFCSVLFDWIGRDLKKAIVKNKNRPKKVMKCISAISAMYKNVIHFGR